MLSDFRIKGPTLLKMDRECGSKHSSCSVQSGRSYGDTIERSLGDDMQWAYLGDKFSPVPNRELYLADEDR